MVLRMSQHCPSLAALLPFLVRSVLYSYSYVLHQHRNKFNTVCSVPQWLRAGMAPCWNGHREARATSAQNARNNGIMYTNIRIRGMDGRGWGVWGWVANG